MNERPPARVVVVDKRPSRMLFVRDLLRAMISSIGGAALPPSLRRIAAAPKEYTEQERAARKKRNRSARAARAITRTRSRRDGRKRATR